MATAPIVIELEHFEFPRQIHGIPEENTIEVLTPNCPDQPFDERMRNRDVENRLDLIDFDYAQVGESPMIAPGEVWERRKPAALNETFQWSPEGSNPSRQRLTTSRLRVLHANAVMHYLKRRQQVLKPRY
jgi:hypothetical protein